MLRPLSGLIRLTSLVALFCVVYCAPAFAQRTQLKPPWNIYSPNTDIQVGKQNAQLMMQKLPLCNDPKVDQYLTNLGLKLVSKLDQRGATYPWEFHCVNDKSINAFALPGGYVFVNRGAIEAADNEAQRAGVMAHELSHVALRHGTTEATKARAAQGFVGILGAILGDNAGGALLTELGRFSAGGVLLRYSRSSETQADVMGTQVLYDAGYDPRALAQFFEKIEADSKGQNPPEFFSDHPNPEHRVERVDEEIEKMGGLPAKIKKDSAEFEAIKREVQALPVVKKETLGGAPIARPIGPPALPSANYAEYQAAAYLMKYPDNWKKYGEKSSISFAPDGGVMEGSDGEAGLAYGVIVSVTKAEGDASDAETLEKATQEMIALLQKGNPKMKIERQPGRVRVNGLAGLSTHLSNESPAGGEEMDWLITVIRPEGLVSFVCVAPQKDYEEYDKTFSAIV